MQLTTATRRAMVIFTLMTLLPVAFLAGGLAFGGWAAGLALLFITLVVALLDRFGGLAAPAVPQADEFPAADGLCVTLALAHLVLLFWGVQVLATAPDLSMPEKVVLFLGLALWIGQVSNPNAHELIHRPGRLLRALGVLVYCSIGYGHHASAHRLVHHRHVATRHDPNTARRGEGFWRFALRAWPGEYLAGLRAERDLRHSRVSPYVFYTLGAVMTGLLAWGLGGRAGLLVWMGLAFYAQLQLLLSDYVQHYGLQRGQRPDGRREPVGPQHSWDAPPWASSALMLNAPRHADHHAHPQRPYPGLDLPAEGLRLPYSLPVMASLALVPPLWFRVMNPRLPPVPRA